MIVFRKTSIYISLLLFVLVVLVVGSSVEANSGGKFNSANSCSCHGASSSSVTPTHSGFPTDYVPGQTYLVTIGMTTSVSGSNGGFSFTVNKGTLTNPGPNVQISGSSATHTNDGARSWSFEWTAPSSGSGTVNLQVATNAVNNNGATSGDSWATLSWTINEDAPPPDSDGDGINDDEDLCPNTPNGESVNVDGCSDSQLDDDEDGVTNDLDLCNNTPNGESVNVDGCSDSQLNIDTDGDGHTDDVDDCVDEAGYSHLDRMGCPDYDADGYSDPQIGWTTADGADAFPSEETQWADQDGDGFGDNPDGWYADDCVDEAGYSDIDRMGCPDFDGDGFSDPDDDWPILGCDSLVGICADAFMFEYTQWTDVDGDGFGDNFGNQSWEDTRDHAWPGHWVFMAQNQDACPLLAGTSFMGDLGGCPDGDGDGWADTIDYFDSDPTQYWDMDRDGYGDNQTGNNADACLIVSGNSTEDRLGCPDSDGDGYSDPTSSWLPENCGADKCADAFINNSNEWIDSDGDGVGDNSDQCEGVADALVDADNDGIDDGCDDFIDSDGDQISDADEILNGTDPNMADTDEDGVNDRDDVFPTNATEIKDTDGDGVGDNADAFDNDANETTDTDMDGVGDNSDICPNSDDKLDYDEDNIPDGCDPLIDNDGDGVSNSQDAFPNDANETTDSDGNGIGDNKQAAAELAADEEAKQKMMIWSSVIIIVITLCIGTFFVLRKKDMSDEIPKQSPIMNFNNPPVVQQAYVPEPTVVNQWTDQAGHTWRSMSDGSTLWWNGTDWQKNIIVRLINKVKFQPFYAKTDYIRNYSFFCTNMYASNGNTRKGNGSFYFTSKTGLVV